MKKQQHSLVNLASCNHETTFFIREIQSKLLFYDLLLMHQIRGNEEVAHTPVFLAEEDDDRNIVRCLEDLTSLQKFFSRDQDHLTVIITTWSRTTKE